MNDLIANPPTHLECPLDPNCDWQLAYPDDYTDPACTENGFLAVLNARRDALMQSVNDHFASHGSDLHFEYA